jgi:hypothetical protein
MIYSTHYTDYKLDERTYEPVGIKESIECPNLKMQRKDVNAKIKELEADKREAVAHLLNSTVDIPAFEYRARRRIKELSTEIQKFEYYKKMWYPRKRKNAPIKKHKKQYNTRALASKYTPEQILNIHGIQVPGSRKIVCINPMHHDSNPSMHVYDSNVFCYSCRASYDSIGIVRIINNYSFVEALKWLDNK